MFRAVCASVRFNVSVKALRVRSVGGPCLRLVRGAAAVVGEVGADLDIGDLKEGCRAGGKPAKQHAVAFLRALAQHHQVREVFVRGKPFAVRT